MALYEPRNREPLSRAAFASRLLAHMAVAICVLGISLAIGMLGYIATERLPAIDAFLNTAMLLGGMGPVNPPVTWAGKLFAGLFALYAGLVFIVVAALVLGPVVHRVLHKFHWVTKDA
jgi:hypothetical protein